MFKVLFFPLDLNYFILKILKNGKKVVAHNFTGERYDIGNKIGLLKANIHFGLRNKETGEELKEYLQNIKL